MKVVICDDSLLFREGLCRLLMEAGLEVVGLAGNVAELLTLVSHRQAQLAIVDIRMPPTYTTERLDAAIQPRRLDHELGVVVLSHYVETEHVDLLMANGARSLGYLLKDRVGDLAELAAALHRVGRGGSVIDPLVVDRLVRSPRGRDRLGGLSDRAVNWPHHVFVSSNFTVIGTGAGPRPPDVLAYTPVMYRSTVRTLSSASGYVPRVRCCAGCSESWSCSAANRGR